MGGVAALTKLRALDLFCLHCGRRAEMERRFWSKVEKSAGCWRWTAAKYPSGYGAFCVAKPFVTTAHRVAYQLTHGPISADQVVCHACDNPECVNPAHLFVGSHADNVADMVQKGRNAKGDALHHVCQKGSANNAAKLTAKDVLQIRRRFADGAARKDIARDFGVHYSTVWAIATGRRWGHVQ